MDVYKRLANCTGFEWDEGNLFKNWEKHRVTAAECEQIFFTFPMVAVKDPEHSQAEERFYALEKTDAGRLLTVIFTFRRNQVRIISARDMSRRERKEYGEP